MKRPLKDTASPKRRRGRPGLADEVAKIQVVVSADLDRRLRRKAEQAGKSYPAWLRAVLEQAAR